jgi:hypothetical protein
VHQALAGRQAIARKKMIQVLRPQAVWAVVAVNDPAVQGMGRHMVAAVTALKTQQFLLMTCFWVSGPASSPRIIF